MKHSWRLLSIVGAVAVAAGCGDSRDEAGPDAGPSLNGTWNLARVVTGQPTDPRCAPLADSGEQVRIATDEDPVVSLPQRIGGLVSNVEVAADVLRFVSEEYGLLAPQPTWPILIGHDLTLDGDQLIGTGRSQGDDIYLGCTWDMTVTGTRVR